MKFLLLLSILLSPLEAATSENEQRIVDADSIVWLGLDYGDVLMIGSYGFTNPQEIFPGFLMAWNGLFIKEMIPSLSLNLRKPIQVDIEAVNKRNRAASPDQILIEPGFREGSSFSAKKIQDIIKSYELERTEGVGLVFLFEYLLKDAEEGCMYVTFFDIESRQILLSQQMCEPPSGFGFRNYWFGSVKRVVKKTRANRRRVTFW